MRGVLARGTSGEGPRAPPSPLTCRLRSTMVPSLSSLLALLVSSLVASTAAQTCSVPTCASTLTTVYSDAGSCTLTGSSAAL